MEPSHCKLKSNHISHTEFDGSYGAIFGLLKVSRCLLDALKQFRACPAGSLEAGYLWHQYEKRWSEAEEYKDMLSEEVVDLAMTHVICSYRRDNEEAASQVGRAYDITL